MDTTDQLYMQEALELAKQAELEDEVPVGCVIVHKGQVIARQYNKREHLKRATAHAELLAIEEACATLGGWRLPDCTLYVTMEPCPMCAGAIVNARIPRVVFGAQDLRFGAYGSCFNIQDFPLNHKSEVERAVLLDECRSILTEYFKTKRKKEHEE